MVRVVIPEQLDDLSILSSHEKNYFRKTEKSKKIIFHTCRPISIFFISEYERASKIKIFSQGLDRKIGALVYEVIEAIMVQNVQNSENELKRLQIARV